MRIDQKIWTPEKGWIPELSRRADETVGELSPLNQGGICALHNQTMTITVLSEK
jgi:hypothetical protein